MSVKQNVTKAVVSTAIDYISGDPEKNFPKLLSFMESIGWNKKQTEPLRKILNHPGSNWYQFIMNLWNEIDNDVLKTIFINLGVNATYFGIPQQRKLSEQYDCNVPWAILLDPTSACNLHCTGCWAAEYGNKLHLSYREMDNRFLERW